MTDELRAYEVLGLQAGVSQQQIKEAHRNLVKVWHPDRFGSDSKLQVMAQEKLKEINAAYDLLRGPATEPPSEPSAAPPPQAPPQPPARRRPSSPPPPSGQKAKTWTPAGIGGWLLFVAVGLCIAPIRIGAEIVTGLRPLEPATWHAITTPGTRAYHPLFGPLIVGELVVNAALFIWAGVLLYLFFGKRRSFPTMMITFLVARVLFQAADLGVALMIPITAARIGGAVYGALVAGILVAVIWGRYFVVSKRVEATFVR